MNDLPRPQTEWQAARQFPDDPYSHLRTAEVAEYGDVIADLLNSTDTSVELEIGNHKVIVEQIDDNGKRSQFTITIDDNKEPGSNPPYLTALRLRRLGVEGY